MAAQQYERGLKNYECKKGTMFANIKGMLHGYETLSLGLDDHSVATAHELHQENLVFTYCAFSLLFILSCKKVKKAIPYTCQTAFQAHCTSRLCTQVNPFKQVCYTLESKIEWASRHD